MYVIFPNIHVTNICGKYMVVSICGKSYLMIFSHFIVLHLTFIGNIRVGHGLFSTKFLRRVSNFCILYLSNQKYKKIYFQSFFKNTRTFSPAHNFILYNSNYIIATENIFFYISG